MKKYLLMLFVILFSKDVISGESMLAETFYARVNSIDTDNKKIEVNHKIYSYHLKFGNIFFESLRKQKPIIQLRTNRSYFVEIRYKNRNDFENKKNGFVIYVGKIKPLI